MDEQTQMIPQPEHLFVYGTLRREFKHPMAQLLAQHADFVGAGMLTGRLYDFGGYPGLIYSENDAETVLGDVYVLRDAAQLWPILDEYEDYRPGQPALSLYLREEVSITMVEGGSRRAWVYLYNRPVKRFPWIKSGDYLRYLRTERGWHQRFVSLWLRVSR